MKKDAEPTPVFLVYDSGFVRKELAARVTPKTVTIGTRRQSREEWASPRVLLTEQEAIEVALTKIEKNIDRANRIMLGVHEALGIIGKRLRNLSEK